MKHKVSFCYLAGHPNGWATPSHTLPQPLPPPLCLPSMQMKTLPACRPAVGLVFSPSRLSSLRLYTKMFLRLFTRLIDESRDVCNVSTKFPDYYLIKNNTQHQHIAQVCATLSLGITPIRSDPTRLDSTRGQFDWFLCNDSLTSWLNKRLEEVFIYPCL